MYWMLLPFRRYAEFSGRSRRLEYWMFMLFNILVMAGLVIAMASFGSLSEDSLFSGITGILFVIYFMIVLVPSVAVQVRRFHDQGRSGWMILLGLIPYIGGLISFVFMCIPGDVGENEYGPDPKDDGSAVANVFA